MKTESADNSSAFDTNKIRPWFFLLMFGLCVRGFFDISTGHNDFYIPYGLGVLKIVKPELAFYAWYAVVGICAVAMLSAAVFSTSIPTKLEHYARRLFERPKIFLSISVLITFIATVLFHFIVLQGAPVTDDESTYVFIAQTLLQGQVVNPLPGDMEFFKNQFVVMNEAGWFGKYPIGHPLILAIGEAVHLRSLMMPLVTAFTLFITYLAGIRIFGKLVASLGICLLLLSPQYIFTGGTQLSQPTSTMFTMLGVLFMLNFRHSHTARWALAAGAAWGAAILVRPFPGLLFLLVALLLFLFDKSYGDWKGEVKNKVKMLLCAALPVTFFLGIFLLVNYLQTGASMKTGYHEAHSGLGILNNEDGQISFSVFGALLRQNFWFLGWPISFIFIPFARGKGMSLVWGLVLAEYGYRILVPKTVVATTGPVYVAEIVPLLALATAAGIVGLKGRLEVLGGAKVKKILVSITIAAIVTATIMFIPFQVRSIGRSGYQWNTAYRFIDNQNAAPALVFCDQLISPQSKFSWAYFPPSPSPHRNEDVIFVRNAFGPDSVKRMEDFHQKHFPKRSVWQCYFKETGELTLLPGLRPMQVEVDQKQ